MVGEELCSTPWTNDPAVVVVVGPLEVIVGHQPHPACHRMPMDGQGTDFSSTCRPTASHECKDESSNLDHEKDEAPKYLSLAQQQEL